MPAPRHSRTPSARRSNPAGHRRYARRDRIGGARGTTHAPVAQPASTRLARCFTRADRLVEKRLAARRLAVGARERERPADLRLGRTPRASPGKSTKRLRAGAREPVRPTALAQEHFRKERVMSLTFESLRRAVLPAVSGLLKDPAPAATPRSAPASSPSISCAAWSWC